MNRNEYYKQMRDLALQMRDKHNVETRLLNKMKIRKIYKDEEVRIDKWDIKSSRIRAAYFCDNDDYSVMVNKRLPKEPYLFALVHELKHHYVDRDIIRTGKVRCGNYNANELIEKGAEVFAAEFIYPEDEMREHLEALGITQHNCTPETVVEFKRSCPAIISYTFIRKRIERFGFCEREKFKQVQFQKLEEELYGLPIYKTDVVQGKASTNEILLTQFLIFLVY